MASSSSSILTRWRAVGANEKQNRTWTTTSSVERSGKNELWLAVSLASRVYLCMCVCASVCRLSLAISSFELWINAFNRCLFLSFLRVYNDLYRTIHFHLLSNCHIYKFWWSVTPIRFRCVMVVVFVCKSLLRFDFPFLFRFVLILAIFFITIPKEVKCRRTTKTTTTSFINTPYKWQRFFLIVLSLRWCYSAAHRDLITWYRIFLMET